MTATIGLGGDDADVHRQPVLAPGADRRSGRQNGGVTSGGIVMLHGQAPAGGAVVSLSSSSPAARPPATRDRACRRRIGLLLDAHEPGVRRHAGDDHGNLEGVSVQATTTLTPQPKPTSITLDPTTTSGSSGSSDASPRADPRDADVTLSLASSRPDLVRVPGVRDRAAVRRSRWLRHLDHARLTRTVVDISVSGGGVTLTAQLTLEPVAPPPPPPPPPAATVSALSVSPSSVTAGTSSTGKVTLSSAAPAGGLAVSLSSSSTAAGVPASVTVRPVRRAASFAVSTTSGRHGDDHGDRWRTSRSATLTITATGPPPATDTVTITRAEWSSGRLRVGGAQLGLERDAARLRDVDRRAPRDDLGRPVRDHDQHESGERDRQEQPRRAGQPGAVSRPRAAGFVPISIRV